MRKERGLGEEEKRGEDKERQKKRKGARGEEER